MSEIDFDANSVIIDIKRLEKMRAGIRKRALIHAHLRQHHAGSRNVPKSVRLSRLAEVRLRDRSGRLQPSAQQIGQKPQLMEAKTSRGVIDLRDELLCARRCFLCFVGGGAPRPGERATVLHMQPEPAFARSNCVFHVVRLHQRPKQRLRLGDLGHFRRRRKAFERGREDGVRVGGAGGRLVELRQPERRLQAEAKRALRSRDGDGGAIGVFGAGRICRLGLQEDVAANAMQEGVRPMLVCLLGQRQRLVNLRQSPVRVRIIRLEFGKETTIQR